MSDIVAALRRGHPVLGPDAVDLAAADEIERLRAALREIAAMRREDLPLAAGLPEDNLAAHHARLAVNIHKQAGE